jgi:hypothetical protein
MHKRTLGILLAGFLLFANSTVTASTTDSFAFLEDVPLYSTLLEATKNSGDFETASRVRDQIHAFSSPALDQEMKTVLDIKADTAFARLCTGLSPSRDALAREILEEAKRKADTLPSDTLFSYCSLADIYGVWYLADSRNLGKGMASSRNVNKAYDNYPDEVSAILLKASSMTFMPSFSDKQVKKALDLYLGLLAQKEVVLARWDLASLYSGIGIACWKIDDFQNALGYLSAAKALYGFDPTVDEYLAKVREAT